MHGTAWRQFAVLTDIRFSAGYPTIFHFPSIRALRGAPPALGLEGFTVKRLSAGSLSPIEKEVIDEIRALRASPRSVLASTLLASPARFVHHFIHASHGNVQLRIATIAGELGVEMRTLERAFFDEYQKTMVQCQVEVRLAFSQWLLGVFPPTKISVIAVLLGYDRVQGFNRFFKKYMRQSPSAWGSEERERITHKQTRPSPD